MTANEVVLIDRFVSELQSAREIPLPGDVAFELFAAGMMLRDHDLTDDEIEAGRVGGGQDGAIDAAYVFLDGGLLDEDSPVLQEDFLAKDVRKRAELTLRIMQAKRETSFTETAFDKVQASTSKLLDLNLTDAQLSAIYSPDIVRRMRIFTKAWTALGIRSPRITIEFAYVTKGDTGNVAPAVTQKCTDFEAHLAAKVPGAETTVRLIGARELWEIADSAPEYDLQLRFEDYVSKGESYVGLVTLADYFSFLADGDGELMAHLFDSNVRDFQGDVTVNKQIKATLETDDARDFWWLNNGVTILCSRANIGGDKTFTLSGVQIVNGMQTSHAIHAAVRAIGAEHSQSQGRSVQVRVVKTADDKTRDDIIRATNSQTKVPDASLHATEDLHRQIESHFFGKGWYYDRRKNFYKNSGKPSDRIVGIAALGQAIMAIGLSRPADARARPSTLLNNPTDYRAVFSKTLPLETYLWIAAVQRRVDSLLLVDADAYTRTNLRFYISLYLVTRAAEERIYNPAQLNSITGSFLTIEELDVWNALSTVTDLAESIARNNDWALDRVAKGTELAESVIVAALETGSGS